MRVMEGRRWAGTRAYARQVTWAAGLLKYRPSPPRAMVLPFTSSPSELKSA